MNLPLDTDINEKTRDALVDFYLKQLVPASSFDRKIETPEDLYEYLLIDPEISSQVTTSCVASAISSLQTYVTDVSLSREPNVFLSKDAAKTWQQVYQQYSIWAANQLLSLYPENYIDPSLRLSKTTLFQALETALSQGLLTEDTVQKAVFAYLNDFEKTSNLEIVSGFQTTPEINNAEIYFVGRTRIQPYEYYWRKVDMRQHDPSDPTLIYPSAWSEWKKIELPIINAVNSMVRPVFFQERLFIVWLSIQDEEDPTKPKPSPKKPSDDAAVHSIRKLYLKLGFKKFDDSWSPTQSHSLIDLGDRVSGDDPQGKVETQIHDLLVTTSPMEKPTILFGIYGEDTKLFPAFYLLDELLTLTKTVKLDAFKDYPFHTPSNPKDSKKSIVMPIIGASYFVSTILLRHKHSVVPAGVSTTVLMDALKLSAKVILKDGKPTLRITVELLLSSHYVTEANLVFNGPSGTSPVNKKLDLKTGFVTQEYELPADAKNPLVYKVDCVGKKGQRSLGEDEYEIRLKPEPVYKESSAFFEEEKGVQWLKEGTLAIRLNTLFAKKLIRLANISIDALLHIFNQQNENAVEEQGQLEDLDFHGANGLYFWELFFYMPFLVAVRLNQAQRFEQATHWFHYLFDPTKGSQLCWQVKVLLEEHNTTQQVGTRLIAPSDPDSIASAHPIHYRKAIFRYYVNNLIDQGDSLYRELTPDSLTEAKSYYMTALRLLGPRPEMNLDSYWKPIVLEKAVKEENEALNVFAAGFLNKIAVKDSYAHEMAFSPDPTITNLTHGLFEKPINKLLLACWDKLASRLYNLRHNLTIDGKPLHLPLFAKPANPLALLTQRGGEGAGSILGLEGPSMVPYYRFNVLIVKAQAAVDTLIQFGNNLLSVFERKEMRQWEKLQQDQQKALLDFSISMQDESVALIKANNEALDVSKKIAEKRYTYYDSLYKADLSFEEDNALNLLYSAASACYAATPPMVLSGIAGLLPNIFGLADGGSRLEAPEQAIAGGLLNLSFGLSTTAGSLEAKAQYQRRHQDWGLQRDLASYEKEQVEKQIAIGEKQLKVTQFQFEQVKKQQVYIQETLDFFASRVSNQALYQWVLGQLSALYFQVYDSVNSLCLSAEAAWQCEVGDFSTRFIQPGVWKDVYHGLLAGETLKLSLYRMEQQYLNQPRKLEITKTVSLRELMKEGFEAAKKQGIFNFQLGEKDYDLDYPYHYCRQLVTVSVSLPAVIGPYQDIKACLIQTTSRFLIAPDAGDFQLLWENSAATGNNIQQDLRARSQIALSTGMDDSGLFVLNFGDDRYLPFEGTGAISSWQLTFPNPTAKQQKLILDSLTDVIIKLRYTAKDGSANAEFKKAVEAKVGTEIKRQTATTV
jgi:hypothetical protein